MRAGQLTHRDELNSGARKRKQGEGSQGREGGVGLHPLSYFMQISQFSFDGVGI